jgi:hypothetical protein
VKKLLVAIGFLLVSSFAQASSYPASLLCMTPDKELYIDIVSTGKKTAFIQFNGGVFLNAEAEFEDPILYVSVALEKGVFVLAYDVVKEQAVGVSKFSDTRELVIDLTCKFRM